MELVRHLVRVLVDVDWNAIIFFQNFFNLLPFLVRFGKDTWMTHPNSFVQLPICVMQIEQGADNNGFALLFLPLAVLLVKLNGKLCNYNDDFLFTDLNLLQSGDAFLICAVKRIIVGRIIYGL